MILEERAEPRRHRRGRCRSPTSTRAASGRRGVLTSHVSANGLGKVTELRRYVALGDSYSAGLPEDDHPPWPDLLADDLRRASPSLDFWNLAVVGATTPDVVSHQVPVAVELRPDLVTLVCGLNDLLWSVRPDPDAFRESLVTSVGELLGTSPQPLVVLATMGDVSGYVPFRPRSRARVARGIAAFNGVVRTVAARNGCALVDVERSPHSADPMSFAPDGIHATLDGHLRMVEGTIQAIRGAVSEAFT